MANLPSVEDLLAAGSHFGHQTQRWNPKMKPYILAEKNGIYVLNLSKTRDLLEEAAKAAAKISESGKTVLFVGTKPTARQCVLDAAAACNQFSVTNRWLGGMLTNFQTVRKSIKKIDKIDAMEQDGTFQALSKKEVLDKNREREKLLSVFGGIREMVNLPGLLVVTDLAHEKIAVAEARRLHIPIIGICDTNVDPTLVDYPVPANDDAVKSIKLIVDYIAANVRSSTTARTSNMQITASLVNELRQKTGVGMMQCKKALTETDGDMDKAVELLRKQGAAVAAKRADKAAKEGRIYLVETADKAAAFELSCETEPVSNNEDFVALANLAVKAVETQAISSVEDLKNAVVDGVKINDRLQDVLVKIQENIDFRKFGELKKVPNSVFGVYSHMKGKIGVITELAFEGSADEAALKAAAKDIAMQAAAFAPVALNDASVPAETIEKEKEIAKAQIEASGKQTKPEFMQRQIDGRVAKVLKEIVLEDQEFFMSEKNRSASRTTSRKSLPSSSVFPA